MRSQWVRRETPCRARLIVFDAPGFDESVECDERILLGLGHPDLLDPWSSTEPHWKHLRTTNVIESSFATVRHRTVRSKGCLSNKTALAMIFKLAEAAEKSWRRLDGHNQLPKVFLMPPFAVRELF